MCFISPPKVDDLHSELFPASLRTSEVTEACQPPTAIALQQLTGPTPLPRKRRVLSFSSDDASCKRRLLSSSSSDDDHTQSLPFQLQPLRQLVCSDSDSDDDARPAVASTVRVVKRRSPPASSDSPQPTPTVASTVHVVLHRNGMIFYPDSDSDDVFAPAVKSTIHVVPSRPRSTAPYFVRRPLPYAPIYYTAL